jgi:hypothetical protein
MATPGEMHPLVAENLNNPGFVYRAAGGYTRAEQLQRQALADQRTDPGTSAPGCGDQSGYTGPAGPGDGKREGGRTLHQQASRSVSER